MNSEPNLSRRLVTVVIPLYKTSLSDVERWALARNLDLLSRHDIAVVCPDGLDLSPLDNLLADKCRIERFAPHYFAGREGYNRLMMSADLYRRFASSQYMLVCQTDVALFRDDLDRWCTGEYDYVGAPWLPAPGDVAGWNVPRRAVYAMRRLWGRLVPGFHPINLKWRVGNGGFSLRRVEAFLEVLDKHADVVADVVAHSDKVENFEDVFWSVGVNARWRDTLRVPEAREAAHFSMEGHPAMAMTLTGGELPMGTHAFYRRRNRDFWHQYLDFP